MIGKRLRDPVDSEMLHRHAEMRDRRLGIRAALRQADVLETRSDAETGRHVLVMLNRQAE
jgi:hypothetical protein